MENDCKFNIFCKDSKNNNIFSCLYKTDKDLPRLAILSGLHGDEPGGPYGILDFLKNKKFYENTNILSIPIMNPYGIEKKIRNDATNKDLNRQWDSNDRKIVTRTKKIVLKFKPNLLLSLHEDSSVDGFYLYPSKNFSKKLLEKIYHFLKKHLPNINKNCIHGDNVVDGIVESPKNPSRPKHTKSMEYFFEKKGIPNITIELPSKLSLEKRSKIYCDVLAQISAILK